MRYEELGRTYDHVVTVRLFLDDGRVYDKTFGPEQVSPKALMNALVFPIMEELMAVHPDQEILDDPDSDINQIEGPAIAIVEV